MAALAARPILKDIFVQTDVDEIILQYENRIKSLLDENQNFLKMVQQFEELKEKYAALVKENSEIKNASISSQDNIQLLTFKLNAANYEIELQNNELTSMRNEISELRSSCANLNQEMNHLQANHRELLNKIAMDAESIQNMKGSKSKLQSSIKNLELENKLLHINYASLQSLTCRTCNKTISQIYNESRQPECVVSNTIGEDAFDNLPDEMSQTDEIRQTESRLLENSMKDMVNNSRMLMNSSILLKSSEKKREISPPPSRALVAKTKSMNAPSRGSNRDSKPARLKSPKLEAVILPPTCAECLKRVKNDPKVLPTALQNLDLHSTETVSPLSAEFIEMGTDFLRYSLHIY